MHSYGEKIYTVRPKFIYFIGMSLTGLVLAIYGLKTGLYLVMIPCILVFAYGIFVILRRRIVFYSDALVIYDLALAKVIRSEDIERLLWHEQVPYNMALKAQHKPAVKCAIVVKNGPSVTLDCGLYKKLREILRDYARHAGIPSEVV